MGHLRNIRHHCFPADILSHCKGQVGRKGLKFPGLQQIPERHCRILFIRHLDAHRRFSRYRGFDSDIRSRQIQFNIIRQSYYLAHLHALLRLQLISRNCRPLADIRDRYSHPKSGKRLLQMDRRFL